MTPLPEVVGVVLAGGASRRLGLDKALLPLDGEGGPSLVEWAVERLAVVCAEVAVADREQRLVPGRPSLADGAGAGPAAGILGAAAAYPARALLVLACDLPLVPASLLRHLAAADAAADAVAPRWRQGIEPLCALYRPPALAALGERVRAGRCAVHPLFAAAGLRVGFVDGRELAAWGDPADTFLNVNRPADRARLAGAPPRRSALLATVPGGR